MNIRPTGKRSRRVLPISRTAVAGAAGLALGLSLAAGPAQADGETEAAVAWVDSQLVDGLVFNEAFQFTDVGLSIDVGVLAIATGDTDLAQRVYAAVVPAIDGGDFPYSGGGTAGGEGEVYASAIAKAARFVQLSGDDATDVNGRDLITDLEVLTDDATGRIADQSGFGDFANTFGQAFAAAALTAAGSDEADASLSFLLDQQCPAGGFRQSFGTEATGATCTDDTEAGADVTGLAVQLLAPLGLAAAERSTAADWLETVQAADGAYGAEDGENTNSAGLAAYALSLEGRDDAARSAADYVRGLQVRAPGVCTDVDEGAIAFDRAGFDGQKLDGITDALVDQFVRATAQAGLALDFVSDPTEDLTAVGPLEYVRARSLQPVLVSGLASRDTVCVSNNGFGVDEVAGIDGTSTVRVTTGPGTATRVFEVADTYGRTAEVSMRVLGPTSLTVRAPFRARQGTKMRVTASGLASGEIAKLFVSRGDVRTAYANRDGRVIFRGVDVARAPGKRKYVVRGKFSRIRKGSDVVRVLPSR